jgi:hypothetical protein
MVAQTLKAAARRGRMTVWRGTPGSSSPRERLHSALARHGYVTIKLNRMLPAGRTRLVLIASDDVRCVLSGDLQIGSMVAGGFVKLVVFLRDPLTAHAHDPDIQALMNVCDVRRVPLATNVATARLCLAALAPVI